jgi:hypothetical protein
MLYNMFLTFALYPLFYMLKSDILSLKKDIWKLLWLFKFSIIV